MARLIDRSRTPDRSRSRSAGGDRALRQVSDETRQRAGRINQLMDLIPARFYMVGDYHPLLKASATLDPARAKTTSQLVAEAASAVGAVPSASSSSKGETRKKRSEPIVPDRPADARSRLELREKLNRRIVELREERRRRQSTADKARAAEIREQRVKTPADRTRSRSPPRVQGAVAERRARASSGEMLDDFPDAAVAKARLVDDFRDIEAGRLAFEPKASQLPYGAGTGRAGSKVRHLRAALREEEQAREKLQEAEAEGRGEEARREAGMRKALQRAKGEKVFDDVAKLRKSQKTFERQRLKGREAWAAREEAAAKQAEDKQAKRKENLQKKRNGKRERSGSGRHGFEGKRFGFLNSDRTD
eukprot:TRINITY_DN10307_c0_g1_i1.p1 TRINITY_DN10307_c0_g1~~TRINITY_DN10307_c0_g1_i1.p1  ORF type:complete len:362 (+),score=80.66 TRINITY_DN10307_c0_g1_i1:104-1189(+)